MGFVLNFIFLFSLVWLILYDFLLINYESSNTIYLLGKIFRDLCMALFTGSIFYFLVVHLPNYRDKKQINPIIAKSMHTLIRQFEFMIRDLQEASGLTVSLNDIDPDDLREVCKSVSFESKIPVFPFFDNLLVSLRSKLEDRYDYMSKAIDRMFVHAKYLKADHIKILDEIRSSDFFFFLHNIWKRDMSFQPENLAYLTDAIVEYEELNAQLKVFYESDFSEFRILSDIEVDLGVTF